MFGRNPRTKLPGASFTTPVDDGVVHNDSVAKRRMKSYSDRRSRAKTSTFGNGDVVLVRQPKRGKLSTPFNQQPLLVTKRKGAMVTARRPGGSSVTHNASMFHHLPYNSVISRRSTTRSIPTMTCRLKMKRQSTTNRRSHFSSPEGRLASSSGLNDCWSKYNARV